jgi:hypothetical protein
MVVVFATIVLTILVLIFAKHVQIIHEHLTTTETYLPTYFNLPRLGYLLPYLPLLCKLIINVRMAPKVNLRLGNHIPYNIISLSHTILPLGS